MTQPRIEESRHNDYFTPPPSAQPLYTLGYGDTIQIRVLYHSEYDLTLPVPPDGMISLPRIPAYCLYGKNVSQVKQEITDMLKDQLNNPDVSINVVQYSNLKCLVLGEVRNPGLFNYERDMTLPVAIAMAGGVANSASDEVLIIPKQGKPHISMVYWNEMNQNTIIINPGDIVIIPKKKIHKINIFIDQFFSKVNPLLQFYLNVLDIRYYNETYRTR